MVNITERISSFFLPLHLPLQQPGRRVLFSPRVALFLFLVLATLRFNFSRIEIYIQIYNQEGLENHSDNLNSSISDTSLSNATKITTTLDGKHQHQQQQQQQQSYEEVNSRQIDNFGSILNKQQQDSNTSSSGSAQAETKNEILLPTTSDGDDDKRGMSEGIQVEEEETKTTDEETQDPLAKMKANQTLTLTPTKINDNAFVYCRREMEDEYFPLMYQWNQECKPIVHSVKIFNDQDVFYVLLSLQDLLKPTSKRWKEGSFGCNGVFDGAILSTYLDNGVVLRCPESIRPSQTTLEYVSIKVPASTARCNANDGTLLVPTASNATAKSNATDVVAKDDKEPVVEVVYNTTLMDRCEREDIRYHEGGIFLEKESPKLGIHIVFVGDRNEAFEWAVYHHLLGFDHVWLYVNDDWEGETNMTHRDYITWMPYNFRVLAKGYEYNRTERRAGYPPDIFRVMGQNDALWRAKRMGMDWFGALDSDEYIQIPSSKQHSFNDTLGVFAKDGLKPSDIDTIPRYLQIFREQLGNRYLGIRMNSIPFGKGFNETSFDHLIEYTWRPAGDIGKIPMQRWKLLLNVTCNDYVEIHSQHKGPACPKHSNRAVWTPNANDLHFNHYKLPFRGVSRKGDKAIIKDPNKVEQDTSLADEYGDKLLAEARIVENNEETLLKLGTKSS